MNQRTSKLPESTTPGGIRRPFPRTDRFIPKTDRVFVNRNLRFSQIAAIGFDLDHTLAHYDALAIEKLAFEVTKRKLVEKRNYSRSILRTPYDPEFVMRGLMVDKTRGNVVKADYFRYVARAYHGLHRIDAEERHRIYGESSIKLGADQFVSVDTLFHLPEVYLYVRLIDALEQSGRKVDHAAVYTDVREMIDEAHQDGTLKSVITRNVGNFVRRDPSLPVVLDEFRRAGKKLFLLTNSEWEYSQALLRHLLQRRRNDRSWERSFDHIIVEARKPLYFLAPESAAAPVPIASETGVPAFSGGHASFLEQELKVSGPHILYFGDHTYGDILRSKKSLGWRTAMIVPEVEHEVAVSQAMARQYSALERLAHEHDQLELEKAALGREWRRLSTALHGEAEDGYAVQLLGAYDPRVRLAALGVASSGPGAAGTGTAGTGTAGTAAASVAAPGVRTVSAASADERAGFAGGDGGDVHARLRALLDGAGTGPGGRRTRGDRRRATRLRELEELATRIAQLDHQAASLAGRLRAMRRRIEAAYNPYWGSVFREGNEASRFGQQLKDFACVYTARVSNFLNYPWNYYFQSPVNVMPHDL